MFENFVVPEELRPKDPRFGCGPSLIPMEFVESLMKKGPHYLGTSHRKSGVRKVVEEFQNGLMKYFEVPSTYSVVLGNGGATFLFDAIALGLVEKKIAHFTCGEFSNKWYKASKKVPWIKAEEIAKPFGQGVEGHDVADADVICVTLNETSTGVQHPDLFKVHDGALLAVDATSGAGQVPCDISKCDIFFFSPQKVFASDGGFWIAIMSPKAKERALKIAADKTRYVPDIMNWNEAISNGEKNQTYNTPALATIHFANEQTKKMIADGGYKAVIKDAEKKAKLLYDWAESKSYLSCYIKEDKYRSRAVACIDVDEKANVDDLLKILEKQKIVYGIDGYRKLERNQFRISLFHNISYSDLEKLTKLLSKAIESVL